MRRMEGPFRLIRLGGRHSAFYDPPMWWGIVTVFKGDDVRSTSLDPGAWLCIFDGSVMGDKEAKKLAKEYGKSYVDAYGTGGVRSIRPRLIRSPELPEAARECYERLQGNKAAES